MTTLQRPNAASAQAPDDRGLPWFANVKLELAAFIRSDSSLEIVTAITDRLTEQGQTS